MPKRHAPRRGSLAFLPRGRSSRVVPVIRNWPQVNSEKPSLSGSAGFKVGSTHVITVDDRERTPNFGKPVFNSATIIVAPPILVLGFRAYRKNDNVSESAGEVYMKKPPKELSRKVNLKQKSTDKTLKQIESKMENINKFVVLAYVSPREGGLSQKKPFLFEIGLSGSSVTTQFDYLKSVIGTEIKMSELFPVGAFVDVASISKGKGFQGVVSRMGVKRKPHKSNKTVREVASIGPWNPGAVMYTVPRAGQKGVHQRTEYNKKILSIANASETPITPKGGFPHFGEVKGEYMILKGSIAGPPKGLIRIRVPMRPPRSKVEAPKLLEIAAMR